MAPDEPAVIAERMIRMTALEAEVAQLKADMAGLRVALGLVLDAVAGRQADEEVDRAEGLADAEEDRLQRMRDEREDAKSMGGGRW